MPVANYPWMEQQSVHLSAEQPGLFWISVCWNRTLKHQLKWNYRFDTTSPARASIREICANTACDLQKVTAGHIISSCTWAPQVLHYLLQSSPGCSCSVQQRFSQCVSVAPGPTLPSNLKIARTEQMQTLLPDARENSALLHCSHVAFFNERMLSRVYGCLECRCYSDYLLSHQKPALWGVTALLCPLPAVARCAQSCQTSLLTAGPKTPLAPVRLEAQGESDYKVALVCRTGIKLRIELFSFVLITSRLLRSRTHTNPLWPSHGTCWSQQRASASLLRPGGGISAVKAAQKSSIVSRIMRLGELDPLGPAELHCAE